MLDAGVDDEDRNAALYACLVLGDTVMFRKLFRQADLLDTTPTGGNLMFSAAMTDNQEILAFLIENGALVKSVRRDVASPLSGAVFGGHVSSVDFLIKSGADLNSPIQDDGPTTLMAACYDGPFSIAKIIAKAIVSSNGSNDLNIRANDGRRALHLTAVKGASDMLEFLLKLGADPNGIGSTGLSPLVSAVLGKSEACALMLLEYGAESKSDSPLLSNALGIAARYTDDKMVRVLLEKTPGRASMKSSPKNPKGLTPIHMAASGNHPSVIDILSTNGFPTNALTERGWSALDWAAYYGGLQAVQYFEDRGCDLLSFNREGINVLYLASFFDHLDLVQHFLKKLDVRARINVQNSSGYAALHMAALGRNGKIILMLLSAGADVDLEINLGVIALHIAPADGCQHDILIRLISAKNINHKAFDGGTPVHWSALHGYNTTQFLIANGADATARDSYGLNALQWISFHEPRVSRLLRLTRRIQEDRRPTSPLNEDSLDVQISNKGKEALAAIEQRLMSILSASDISDNLQIIQLLKILFDALLLTARLSMARDVFGYILAYIRDMQMLELTVMIDVLPQCRTCRETLCNKTIYQSFQYHCITVCGKCFETYFAGLDRDAFPEHSMLLLAKAGWVQADSKPRQFLDRNLNRWMTKHLNTRDHESTKSTLDLRYAYPQSSDSRKSFADRTNDEDHPSSVSQLKNESLHVEGVLLEVSFEAYKDELQASTYESEMPTRNLEQYWDAFGSYEKLCSHHIVGAMITMSSQNAEEAITTIDQCSELGSFQSWDNLQAGKLKAWMLFLKAVCVMDAQKCFIAFLEWLDWLESLNLPSTDDSGRSFKQIQMKPVTEQEIEQTIAMVSRIRVPHSSGPLSQALLIHRFWLEWMISKSKERFRQLDDLLGSTSTDIKSPALQLLYGFCRAHLHSQTWQALLTVSPDLPDVRSWFSQEAEFYRTLVKEHFVRDWIRIYAIRSLSLLSHKADEPRNNIKLSSQLVLLINEALDIMKHSQVIRIHDEIHADLLFSRGLCKLFLWNFDRKDQNIQDALSDVRLSSVMPGFPSQRSQRYASLSEICQICYASCFVFEYVEEGISAARKALKVDSFARVARGIALQSLAYHLTQKAHRQGDRRCSIDETQKLLALALIAVPRSPARLSLLAYESAERFKLFGDEQDAFVACRLSIKAYLLIIETEPQRAADYLMPVVLVLKYRFDELGFQKDLSLVINFGTTALKSGGTNFS